MGCYKNRPIWSFQITPGVFEREFTVSSCLIILVFLVNPGRSSIKIMRDRLVKKIVCECKDNSDREEEEEHYYP